MGGHVRGETASALARETIVREVRQKIPLVQAIQTAGAEILQMSQRRDDNRPMGATVVVARIKDDVFELAWIGDSRAYLWQERQLLQVDHHLGRSSSEVGQPSTAKEPARMHSQPNTLTQALGVTDPTYLNVSYFSGKLRPGMQLLLCSDGLTEEVEDSLITAALSQQDLSAQECVDMLVAAALDSGGSDNITVILIRCH
jgi:protein phosphatase